jgi:hypothetical protein
VLVLLAVATTPVYTAFALYARWWWAGGRGPECERLSPALYVAAFAGEVMALTLVTVRALRTAHARQREPTASPLGNIILLAGGPLGEAALANLRDRLAEAGWSTTCFRPSSWLIPSGAVAAELDAFLRAHEWRADTVLIGYGNAGLILRHYLRRFPARGLRHIVTISTPHQGTAAPLVGFGSPPGPSAEAMRQLAAGDRVPHQFEFIAIASDCDEFIAPASAAYYPGAFNIQVRGVGHFALARSPRLFELLMENLGPSPHARGSSMTDSTRAQS